MVLLFYTTNISVDLAHHEIFPAKVGKGGIRELKEWIFYQSCLCFAFQCIKTTLLSMTDYLKYIPSSTIAHYVILMMTLHNVYVCQN